jgi:hypothetical protein
MKNKGSAAPIILGVIALVIVGFFTLEFFRGKELKDNLPEYVVTSSYDEAYSSAAILADSVDGKVHNSEGLSNSWFLPFDKSVIVLDNTPYEDLQKHDFVGYVSGGKKVFHRLIKKTDDGWVAQGDNNANPDKDLVTKSNYTGRLTPPIFTWESAIVKDESLLSIFD